MRMLPLAASRARYRRHRWWPFVTICAAFYALHRRVPFETPLAAGMTQLP